MADGPNPTTMTERERVDHFLGCDDDMLRLCANGLGVDVESHLCDCEFCSRSSALCPASRSSLAEACALAPFYTTAPEKA